MLKLNVKKMKTLEMNELERIEGGNELDGMMCVAGMAAVPISMAATILTGGLAGFGTLFAMGMAAGACANWAVQVR